jgi:RimJ/RimL family protein N-acetyltransferase
MKGRPLARFKDFTPSIQAVAYTLKDGPVTVEALNYLDSQDLIIMARENSAWLEPWTVTDSRYEAKNARSYAIYLEGEGLIGKISLYAIEYKYATLTYWVAERFSNRGVMTKAIGLINNHAVKDLGIKEISAGVFPSNPASARVLIKNGYQKEDDDAMFAKQNGLPIELDLYTVKLG